MKKKITIEYAENDKDKMCDFVTTITKLCKIFEIGVLKVETVEDEENA